MVICSGCATFSSKHVPGDTIADNRLRKGVIRMIGIIEKAKCPRCPYSIIDTKVLGREGNAILEEWTVVSGCKKIVYPVRFEPSPKEGIDFAVGAPKAKGQELTQ